MAGDAGSVMKKTPYDIIWYIPEHTEHYFYVKKLTHSNKYDIVNIVMRT